jgi:hypothetical protein
VGGGGGLGFGGRRVEMEEGRYISRWARFQKKKLIRVIAVLCFAFASYGQSPS